MSLTITIIQTNLFWEDPLANMAMLREKIESLDAKTQVIILPEMFTTGFSMNPEKLAEDMDGPTLRWMREIATRRRVILTGSVMIRENGKYFNRLIWMLPDGRCGQYDKRHLFAYAGEDTHYTAGDKKMIASVNGWKINLQVCYDLRFPVWARQAPGEDPYDILINVANWPEKRINAWTTLLQARAIENQCFTIGVNRVGIDGNHHFYNGKCMITGPGGQVLFEANAGEEIFTFTFSKDLLIDTRARFPFLDDADRFLITP